MSGLFGGGNDAPTTQQPVTLPAPSTAQPGEQKNQDAATSEALKRAQTAGTLATSDPNAGKDDGTYTATKLGG